MDISKLISSDIINYIIDLFFIDIIGSIIKNPQNTIEIIAGFSIMALFFYLK